MIAVAALGAGISMLTGCAPWRIWTAASLANEARPYAAQPVRPAQRILVVGDSTAVGTGATGPLASLPGLIGQRYPTWHIDNLASNGARYADVAHQLERAAKGYDLVLVLAGGNDVIRFTSEAALRRHITAVVDLARQKTARVVVMPCGNVGHAPFFMPPLSWVMSRRSNRLHALVQEISAAREARYVRLLKPRDEDPFVARSAELHAADGLHPSDTGYREWWRELVAQGGLAGLDG
jgi:lysophospholipase L1-like esterase